MDKDYMEANFSTKYEKLVSLIVVVSIVSLMIICWYNLFKLGNAKRQSQKEYYQQYHIDHNLN